MKKEVKEDIILVSVAIFIFIIALIILIHLEIKHSKLKNTYEELCFDIDEVEIDFVDKRKEYDVFDFDNDNHYFIPRERLEVVIDTQDSYIILLISEYDDSYNKAYLVLNVKQKELENE